MEKLENTENVKEENSVTHSTRIFGLLPFGAVMNSIALTQSPTYILAHNGTFFRVYTQEQNFWVKLLKFSALLRQCHTVFQNDCITYNSINSVTFTETLLLIISIGNSPNIYAQCHG